MTPRFEELVREAASLAVESVGIIDLISMDEHDWTLAFRKGFFAGARFAAELYEKRERVLIEALVEIESGAMYFDGKPGRSPKTRAREALQAVKERK